MDEHALSLLAAKTKMAQETPADDSPSSREPSENSEFIGIHCPSQLKSQLQLFAGIERITLSQFIREILQMEVLRLTRGETCSRELLMRERRQAMAGKMSANAE